MIRSIYRPWIIEQWDRMGHFYASLEQDYAEIQGLSNSKNQHTFDRVVARHSYLRQFAPAFQVEPGNPVANSLMEASTGT